MRSRDIAFMTVVVFFMMSGPVASSDWVDIKNPKELRALYSNKTFRSNFWGVPVIEHYHADGKGLRISGEERISRTWEVKGKDQVCTSDEKLGTNCCRFQRNKKNQDEYVRRCQHGSNNYMGTFMVEDGIPEF